LASLVIPGIATETALPQLIAKKIVKVAEPAPDADETPPDEASPNGLKLHHPHHHPDGGEPPEENL
jgi:hypothetical protein